ncbi:MAG: SDR family NAD(P)-dependent oxidoreductase [Dermatophilaceae bacterium]
MRICDTVALVTGGASGLGLATARRLHAEGAGVVLVDLPASDGAAVAASLGGRAAFVPADVTDADQVQAAVTRAVELGTLRIAVSCAGIGPAARVLRKDGSANDLGAFVAVIQVNLVGTFNVLRLAAAGMLAHSPVEGEERGVIVNTASIAAYDGQIGQAAYAASKGGVVGMTLPVARDLAQHRIRVVTIAPGMFMTPLLATLPAEAVAALGAAVPHPARLGDPGEYAALVAHVVQNPMLNGEVIRLDGALRMGPR